ncbi:MAG TPA: DUF397 domain-containing protein [Streptosporangiaceae bacterium]|jgi:hypothetical protein
MIGSQTQSRPNDLAERLKDAVWRKSRRSGTEGNCVEIATKLPGIVVVRDSKAPDGAVLTFEPAAWRAFLRLV